MRNPCLEIFAYAVVVTATLAVAQQQTGTRGVPSVHTVVNFADLAKLRPQAPVTPQQRVVPRIPMPARNRLLPPAPLTPPIAAPQAAPSPRAPSSAPIANFDAQDDNGLIIPPDTMGAVGPNHLVVPLNSGIRSQTKTGTAVGTIQTLDNFWLSTGATHVFDPRMLYDPYNNRWIFSAASDAASANSSLLIGVSTTNDPTGTWHLWRIPADTQGTSWADYPGLGFNSKWIVASVNMFTNTNNSFVSTKTYVFSAADLYAGGAGAFKLFIGENDASGVDFTWVPAASYDPTQTTEYLVQDWDGSHSQLKLGSITGAIGSETLTTDIFPAGSSTWLSCPTTNCSNLDFAPQLDDTHKINTGDSRILNFLYRAGSLWAAQTVFLPFASPTHTAAQWWQFQPDGTVLQFGRVEDANAAVFYAYPSIAVNKNGDALLGFSSFSSTQYASAGYAFRAAADASNTMRDSGILKAGLAPYFKTFSGTENRWGYYSATMVDPVNDLDFWTIQEFAGLGDTAPCSQASCWGTWWGHFAVSPATKKRHGQTTSF